MKGRRMKDEGEGGRRMKIQNQGSGRWKEADTVNHARQMKGDESRQRSEDACCFTCYGRAHGLPKRPQMDQEGRKM